jgi:hypothetical protein
MKFFTYILTFTVIFLSIKPGIDALPFASANKQACCSSITCNQDGDAQDSDNQDDQNNGWCNPFQICGSCVLICTSTADYPSIQANISTETFFGNQTLKPYQLISDFWQPPQIV